MVLGQQAFQRGDWGEAVAAFQAAADLGADTADLHFHLGNAWYRMGQQGHAALAFEKALRRQPGNDDASANLHLVRTEARATVADPGFVQRVGESVSPDDAGIALLLALSLACTFWVGRSLFGRWRWLARSAAFVALCATLAAGFATFASWQVRQQGWAVVLEAGPVLHAPDPGARQIAAAARAQRLQILQRVGGFARVELPSGATGFVPLEQVGFID